mmetsp:Transcript_48306/g.124668  ORF Transcript_48306/g.124668 Transcript_48306/m.124668 type:complete len:351 (-) Transcript_48306:2139-3191(-)
MLGRSEADRGHGSCAYAPGLLVPVAHERRQRLEDRVRVHHEQVTQRLGHHVAHALLRRVRILAEDRQHTRDVRTQVVRQGAVAGRPLRHANGNDLAQGSQQQILRLMPLGRGARCLHVVDDYLQQGAHGTNSRVAQGQRSCKPNLILAALQLLQESVAEARRLGEVSVLPCLAQREQRQLALLDSLRRRRCRARLDDCQEVLDCLALHVLLRGGDDGRHALRERAYHVPLRLRLRIGDARSIAELLPKVIEGAVVLVLRYPGEEEEDGVQRAALEQWRAADVQHRWHALLCDDRGHLRRVPQRLDRHLHAEVRDVEVRVRDKGHDVGQDLHHGLLRHAAAIPSDEMHQGV